jgi:hypothetical protein
MAQKVTVQLVDDLDDSPIADGAGRTVEFSFDGASYEIDLSNDNVDAFREAISDYVAAARKLGGRRASSTPRATGAKRASGDLGKIREWAKDNGYEVSTRGRISAQVQEAYAAAH